MSTYGEHVFLSVVPRREARLKQAGKRSPLGVRALNALFRPIWRMRRGLTLGAQGVVIDAEDRVLLVRHSYRPGWWFPGGGVEWGETLETALARELEEEAGVRLTGPPMLHGVFANFASFPGDHIAVFVVRQFERQENHRRPGEIAEAAMFERGNLPALINAGTRARLDEIFGALPGRQTW
jgi:ADP-ribose pyrophosphatase YjhB (NUDIX family)